MPNLTDHVSTSIILLDLNGRFRYLNQSAEKTLGITARNLLGKRYSYFIDPDSLPIRNWLSQLTKSESRLFDQRHIHLKNGQQIAVELALQKTLFENKEYLLIEWQNNTLARKYQLEKELQRNQQINQQLLKNLAHEIKTPLSGIAGATQLLEMSLDQESLSFSQVISKEVKRLTMLVDRMLLGQKVASRIPFNIHEILEQLIEFLILNLPPDISLKRDYDPSIPELEIAPEQIYQVFLNLAQNALDAISNDKSQNKNQKSHQITFKTRVTKEHPLIEVIDQQVLLVSIIDNGPGIPEELQPNIFFPMISGKNSSGLGLGIAQSLMQQHQGLIEFESQTGHTQFSCFLPLKSIKREAANG